MALSIKELAELEHAAGQNYKSLLGSPVALLCLNKRNAGNMQPFSNYLFPTDKYEMTHSKGVSVSFQVRGSARWLCHVAALDGSASQHLTVRALAHGPRRC
jgi:hypothetical protein